MSGPNPNTALYFGTFNPIHSGHLMIAQAVLSQFSATLGLERILFIPAGNPPHRHEEPDLVPARHRLKMVQAAIADNPCFAVSDIELQRPSKSYTIETLRLLIEQGLVKPPVPLIIGSDALAHLASWHEPEALIRTVRFLQAPRPEQPTVSNIQIGNQAYEIDTIPVDMPCLSLSSTWVRAVLRDNWQNTPFSDLARLRYYLPEPVRQYILQNRLYTA